MGVWAERQRMTESQISALGVLHFHLSNNKINENIKIKQSLLHCSFHYPHCPTIVTPPYIPLFFSHVLCRDFHRKRHSRSVNQVKSYDFISVKCFLVGLMQAEVK